MTNLNRWKNPFSRNRSHWSAGHDDHDAYTPERQDGTHINTTPAGTPAYAFTDTQTWIQQGRDAADRAARRSRRWF